MEFPTCHRIDFIESVEKEEKVFFEDPLEYYMMISATMRTLLLFEVIWEARTWLIVY